MMGGKTVKTTFVTVFVAAVLLVGTVSARQLRTDAKGFAACRGACTSGSQCSSGCICSATKPCPTSNCVCSFTTPTTAFCTTKLAGVTSPKK